MTINNKLQINDSMELARIEEKISKKKAIELFESGFLISLEAGKFNSLAEIHKCLFSDIYEFADEINDKEIYMKGIDTSYYYEGYTVYKAEEL